ncbi:MAG: WbqC family protein [Flavobacterium sp.]
MDILIHPTYFPSISTYIAIAKADSITLEMEDNFQKQTNRNRMYIYSANGLQLLNIPVKHLKNSHQMSKDIKLETEFDWQKQHFKSLEAAYRSSPFFEFFEDIFMPVFEKDYKFLMDLNLDTMAIISKCIGLKTSFFKTEEFKKETNLIDFRNLAAGKKDQTQITPYTQVFGEKYGFLNNLSILDLLFNEGRYSLDYLKSQNL